MKKKNLFLFVNIFLFTITVTLLVKENYVNRVLIKINKSKNIIDKKAYLNNWKYKQELDLYKSYQKKGDIVMLGNSITYRINWNELLNRTDVINRGIGSDVTEGFISRLDYIIKVKPKMCFIMGGINDLQQGIKSSTINSNIQTITKNLKTNNIESIVFSILYVADSFLDSNNLNTKIKKTNELIEFNCNKNNIEFIDLNKKLENNGKLRSEYSFDGIHLTHLGYEKWGEIINSIINEKII